MKMWLKFFVPVLACGLVLSGCSKSEQSKTANAASTNGQAVTAKDKLADFTLKTLKGDEVNLRSFEGKKVVVVNFWATWCGPCRREMPDFNEVYARYRDRNVEFLAVNVEDSPGLVLPDFLQETPIAFPVLLGSTELAMRYGISGLPTTMVIDRSGKITKRHIGMMSAEKLEAEIVKAL